MQKSIFKQDERFHAGYDNHFDHCRCGPKLAPEASPEPAEFTTGRHLRSVGVDRALPSGAVRSENRTSKQGSFPVPTTEPVGQSANDEFLS
jgi:hypothetical protein